MALILTVFGTVAAVDKIVQDCRKFELVCRDMSGMAVCGMHVPIWMSAECVDTRSR